MRENELSTTSSITNERIETILLPDRSEIIETQKARSDLLKWKLLVVAALGTIGLGLCQGTRGNIHALYVLALIPFVAVYVDILCNHLNLRMFVISAYAQNRHKHPDMTYEAFCDKARALTINTKSKPNASSKRRVVSAFDLEDFALKWTTMALCLLLVMFAIVLLYRQHPCDMGQWLCHPGTIVLAAATIGACLFWLTNRSFCIRSEALQALE